MPEDLVHHELEIPLLFQGTPVTGRGLIGLGVADELVHVAAGSFRVGAADLYLAVEAFDVADPRDDLAQRVDVGAVALELVGAGGQLIIVILKIDRDGPFIGECRKRPAPRSFPPTENVVWAFHGPRREVAVDVEKASQLVLDELG